MKRVTKDENPLYKAFLLRCWQEEGVSWRLRVQIVETGEQFGFTSLDSALEFLRGEIELDSLEGENDEFSQ